MRITVETRYYPTCVENFSVYLRLTHSPKDSMPMTDGQIFAWPGERSSTSQSKSRKATVEIFGARCTTS